MNFGDVLDFAIPIGVFILFGALIWKSFKGPIRDMFESISGSLRRNKETKQRSVDGGMYGMGYEVAYR